MAIWLRHPPSPRHVAIMVVAVALALVIAGLERLFGWPEWLAPDRGAVRWHPPPR